MSSYDAGSVSTRYEFNLGEIQAQAARIKQAFEELHTMADEATFTVKKDIIEPYTDGSGTKVIFKAGQVIAWATARELGLVVGDAPKEEKPTKAEPKA